MARNRELDRRRVGKLIEDRALSLLRARGLVLLERNYRCRLGEIDLIMRDGATIVFVEVRHRSSSAFGGAAASIGAAKIRSLRRTAESYLLRHEAASRCPCRFDVVSSDGPVDGAPVLRWDQAAF